VGVSDCHHHRQKDWPHAHDNCDPSQRDAEQEWCQDSQRKAGVEEYANYDEVEDNLNKVEDGIVNLEEFADPL
jgi:hypothetical protein